MEFHFTLTATFTAESIDRALADVPRTLGELAAQIRVGRTSGGTINDTNGKSIGRFTLLPKKLPKKPVSE